MRETKTLRGSLPLVRQSGFLINILSDGVTVLIFFKVKTLQICHPWMYTIPQYILQGEYLLLFP